MAWLLFTILPTAVPAAGPRTFADRVGVNVKFAQGEPMNDLPRLADLGVRWVRDTVLWIDAEPTPGHYLPFPREFQERLAYYKAHDIGVCFGLWYQNPKGYPNDPCDAAAYGRWSAEVTRRLRAAGVRFVIELWNEPHNTMKELGGPWNGEPPCPWLDRYTAMVAEATKAIKAADPDAKVLACDDMWVLHYRFLEHGLPAALDGLAVHPYVKGWPEFSATEADTSWSRPFVTVDADRSLASAVRRLRDFGADKLGHVPAVWITEWGWPLNETVNDRNTTDYLLSGLIPRAYLTAIDAGVETLLWFSLTDSVDGPMGLTGNDRRARRTYDAFKTMTATLGRKTTITHVAGRDHPTSGVQAYRCGGDGVDVLVLWCIDGDTPVRLRGQEGVVHAEDVFGRLVDATPDTLTAGRSPLYLTGVSAGATVEPLVPAGRAPAFLFP